MTDLVLRTATADDAEALHALIRSHLDEGHLLPRDLADLRRHAGRFIVGDVAGQVKACAELAPLSASVAEIRSLVVARDFRRVGLAARLVGALHGRAKAAGFDRLCAFTHDPRFFIRQDFSIVPHLWLPEKIVHTCLSCPLFRSCGQYAMVMPLEAVARYSPPRARPARHVVPDRHVAVA